jgi:hypothetical protein
MAARLTGPMPLDKAQEHEQNMNIADFGNKRLGGLLPFWETT